MFNSHGVTAWRTGCTGRGAGVPKSGVQDIRINYAGLVIGAHSGLGTVALFFIGTQR